jgi:hypothetical protein
MMAVGAGGLTLGGALIDIAILYSFALASQTMYLVYA